MKQIDQTVGLMATGLTVWRGERCLFRDLDLTVPPASAFVVRGANGSGKTTLLRMLAGLGVPDEGSVVLGGISTRNADARGQIAWCGHLSGLKGDLTVAENLRFCARIAGQATTANDRVAGLGLRELLPVSVRNLSAGQRRRVALSIALEPARRIWILDEPYTHLDDQARERVSGLISRHVGDGGMAVIAAHGPLALTADTVVEHTMDDHDD